MKITIKDFRIYNKEELLEDWKPIEIEKLKVELELWKGKSFYYTELCDWFAYTHEDTEEVMVIHKRDFPTRIKSDFCKKHGLSDEIARYLDIDKIERDWRWTSIDQIIEFDCTLTPDIVI